jgi:hypothetical protein
MTKGAAPACGSAGRAWLEWLAPRFESCRSCWPQIERQRAALVPEVASEQVRRVGGRCPGGGGGRAGH